VSNGENVSPPKVSINSLSNCKILSKSEKLSNPETLKTIFKNLSNNSALSNPENLSSGQTVSLKILTKNKTVSKSDYNWP
jgi:hypothetical protein